MSFYNLHTQYSDQPVTLNMFITKYLIPSICTKVSIGYCDQSIYSQTGELISPMGENMDLINRRPFTQWLIWLTISVIVGLKAAVVSMLDCIYRRPSPHITFIVF